LFLIYTTGRIQFQFFLATIGGGQVSVRVGFGVAVRVGTDFTQVDRVAPLQWSQEKIEIERNPLPEKCLPQNLTRPQSCPPQLVQAHIVPQMTNLTSLQSCPPQIVHQIPNRIGVSIVIQIL